jgi:APA family basic amino acid/polyamine antiporter
MKGVSDVFVRNSTGLVRELSAFDAFNLVFSAVLIPVGISQALGFAPAAFQGANIVLSFFIAAVLMFFFGHVYTQLALAMPRSGGDYVWVSRILSPGAGFVTNLALTFVFLTWISFNFTTMLSYFGPAVVSVWGLSPSLGSALSQPATEFLVATVLTGLYTLLMLYGTRRAALFMRVFFVLVWVGMGLWLLGLAITGPGAAHAAFQSGTGQSVTAIEALAAKNGFQPVRGISWAMTLFAMIYAFQVFTGFQWTGYFAGEVKNARRTIKSSIMGALLVSAALYIVGSALVYRSYGYGFYNALVYLGFNDASKLPASVPYVLPALVRFLSLPAAVKDYIGLSFLMSVLWWTPTGFLLGTRNMFAWAFDRLMPESLADVSPRFHTPVKATLVTAVVVELLNVLNIYAGLSAFLVNIIAVMALAFMAVSLAAMLFPYRRRALYEGAPDEVRTKWLGLPSVTIAGALSFLSWGFVLGVAFLTPYFGLQVSFKAMAEAFVVPVLGAVYYLLVRRARAASGVNLQNAFATIPPE